MVVFYKICSKRAMGLQKVEATSLGSIAFITAFLNRCYTAVTAVLYFYI